MPATPPDPAKLAAEWEKVRNKFAGSLMVDTRLTSLAQNLEMTDWPIKGPEETPAKYVELSYEEMEKMPGLMGFPQRVEMLVTLLRETLAFDEPFGEMAAHIETAASKDDPLLKNLARLEVPLDFPLSLTALSADTRSFCDAEKLVTLGDFVAFSQKMAQAIVVGGDFRTLLNALAHADEKALAGFLPFRAGAKGLHLPEAFGVGVRRLKPAEYAGLLRKSGKRNLSPEQEKESAKVTKDALGRVEQDLLRYYAAMEGRFEKAFGEFRKMVKEGGSLERYFMVLEDPDRELVARHMAVVFVKQGAPAPAPAAAPGPAATVAGGKTPAPAEKKSGMFGWLFGKK
jgi:hypothetical protein